jgi:hypothetical protein
LPFVRTTAQILGTIDSTAPNPATVPANKIVGTIGAGVSLEGNKVASRSIAADQFPSPNDENVDDFTPYAVVSLLPTGPDTSVTNPAVINGDVYVCCPKRGVPVQCTYPQITNTQFQNNIYLVCICG